jgi:head-tail adaptor
MSGLTIPTGERRHWADVWTPGAPVPDGDGGWATSWAKGLDWAVAVRPSGADEATRAGTSVGTATHVLTGLYHDGITLKSRLVVNGRVFEVSGLVSPEDLRIETVAYCTELIGAPLPTEAA